MGNPAAVFILKGFLKYAPFGAIFRYQPVIRLPMGNKAHEKMGNAKQAVAPAMPHNRSIALIIYGIGIGGSLIKLPAKFRGKLFAGMITVRMAVSDLPEGGIEPGGNQAVYAVRDPI